MRIINKFELIKYNILYKLFPKRVVIGTDFSNGLDLTCRISGYKDRNNIIHIKNIEFME